MSVNTNNIETESSDGSKTDDSEEVEPVFSYERMKGPVSHVLNDDFASCMCVNSRILILGTHWGKVHVLDHLGNIIDTFDNHEGTVNEVAIDCTEEYVASCGDDGKSVILSLCDTNFNQTVTFNRPIKCIAFEPNYVKTRSYVTGDTALILNEKGFLGRNKTTTLHEGEDLIRTIRWNSSFIAWSNSRGVKIYSTIEKRIITYISKDHDINLRDELYRCSLLWTDPNTLVICWADRLKICKIKLKNALLAASPSISSSSNSIMSFASNAAMSGSVLANTLMKNDKKDSLTYVEISN